MHRSLTVALVAFLVALSPAMGVAGATTATAPASADAATAQGVTDATAESTGLSHVASVTMDNQTTGGTTVTVREVYMPEGGFVAIHDASLDEGGAKVLSSVRGTTTYLPAGTHENVTVTLSQPISNDTTLVAMPHRDTDGDRIYEFVSTGGEADGPYTGEDGNIVVDTAQVTASASVSVTEQPSNGTTVVVDRVEMAEGGFVAIHDGTLLDGETFDSVRGTSTYLPAGVHENVRVTLDEPFDANATIIPMPHRDTNGNQKYDFVTSNGNQDGPYVDRGGNIVLDSAPVTVGGPATATFEDQVSGGSEVIVESTYMPEGGFVAMHDGSLQDGAVFDSVRGTSSYLSAGLHRHVHVELDDPLNDSQPLIAMPHRDTNDNREYDFVTSEGDADGPYTDDGDIVVDSGEVTVAAGVALSDQTSDGRTVDVHIADLPEGGFVTIHDASLGAGNVLGSVRGTSEYLEPGTHEVTVTLDDPLQNTQTVLAMPHRDTNDNEEYDFVTSGGDADGPYTNDGNVVVDPGRITVQAQTTFEAQQTEGDTLTVRSVTLQEGGFVTIHDGTLLDGAVIDSVRGTSGYLGPGTHENVTIQLDDPVSSDGTFIAMPHLDTNGNQEYDFVTSGGQADGPYVADGGAVVAAANVSLAPQAEVTFQKQTSGGNSVSVASVTMSEGGFVAMHDASLQEGAVLDSVRGTSEYLGPGTHEGVTVTLDDPLEETQPLIAMPHLDTDGDEEYDFVSSGGNADGPYTSAPEDSTAGAIDVDVAEVTVASAEVTFEDQTSGGNSVTVASVTMSEGGFVAMHDATLQEGAALDSVRGTSEYLEAGTHEGVTVELEDPLEETQPLIAMPHLDTNGNEEYDFVSSGGNADGPYTSAPMDSTAGAIVVDVGEVTVAQAELTFEDQTTDGESVTVASVSLSEGGFVTAHDASLQDGAVLDSVRGTSDYLESGSHEDVTIELDDPLEETQPIIAMPHLDTNGNGEYDFVSSGGQADGPYTNAPMDSTAGPIVVAVAEISVESGSGSDGSDGGDEQTPDGSSGDGAGFGLVAALLAIAAVGLLARHR